MNSVPGAECWVLRKCDDRIDDEESMNLDLQPQSPYGTHEFSIFTQHPAPSTQH
jgi:hypothetical protein